jgi:RNA polymerase sigma factor (sigma-70 family)
MDEDTDLGGSGRAFPATRGSVIAAAASDDPFVRRGGFEALVRAYWKPAYKYLRIKWRASNEDAKDLTQGFFAVAFEKRWFDRYDAGRAKFRTYLRTCLDGFVANERKSAARLKRGGDTETLSLDFETAEGELRAHEVPDGTDLELFFHREWVRGLFAAGVERLRERCRDAGKDVAFRVFERYDLEGPEAGAKLTYAQLAAELGLPVTQVTNHLFWARRELRAAVLETLRDLVGSDEEFRAEARALFGGVAS